MDPILDTDQYKFAMAEAGWPMREETFYYSHRKGGPHLLPVDVKEYIKEIFARWMSHGYVHMPRMYNDTREELVKASGLHVGAWFEHFYMMEKPFDKLTINTIPKGSWFHDRDPVFTVTGPSFLLSWLEPQILQLNYRIQIATLAAQNKLAENDINMVTCDTQKIIVLETLNAVREMGYKVPEVVSINQQPDAYVINVESRVRSLIDAVDGDAHRLFEVGLRGVTCGEQHELALDACKRAGLIGTSDTYGASLKSLKAVGTMGHEHVQRFGSDEAAYEAMADRVPGSIFCLLDTFDTIKSGIPAAFDLMRRQPERNHVVRFDSGDIRSQLFKAITIADSMGIDPRYCLEDGWNLEKTKEFEEMRRAEGLPADRFLYGYGGHIVKCGWTPLTRDKVAAVWKLTQTGNTPTMKFGSSPGGGKESIPGKPVLWRLWTSNCCATLPRTIVAQEGEDIAKDFTDLYSKAYESEPMMFPTIRYDVDNKQPNAYSDGTKILRHRLYEKNLKQFEGVKKNGSKYSVTNY
jgi:nicotinic acid phosphoribosyltransferase